MALLIKDYGFGQQTYENVYLHFLKVFLACFALPKKSIIKKSLNLSYQKRKTNLPKFAIKRLWVWTSLSQFRPVQNCFRTTKRPGICQIFWDFISGPPRLTKPPRPRPCLDFAEQKMAAAVEARRWCVHHCAGLACQKLAVAALIIVIFHQSRNIPCEN